jgi:hypothetical protein
MYAYLSGVPLTVNSSVVSTAADLKIPLSNTSTAWTGALGLIDYMQSISISFSNAVGLSILTDINNIYQQALRRLPFSARAQLLINSTTGTIAAIVAQNLFWSGDDYYQISQYISTQYTGSTGTTPVFTGFTSAVASTFSNGAVNPIASNTAVLNLLGAMSYLVGLTPGWAFETVVGRPSWSYTANTGADATAKNAIYTSISIDVIGMSPTAPSDLFTQYFAWGLVNIIVNGFQPQATLSALAGNVLPIDAETNTPDVYNHLPAFGATSADTINFQKNQAIGLAVATKAAGGSANAMSYLLLQLPSPTTLTDTNQQRAQAIINLQQLLLSTSGSSGVALQTAFNSVMQQASGLWNQTTTGGALTNGVQSTAPTVLTPTQIFLYAISQDPLIASTFGTSTSLNLPAVRTVSTGVTAAITPIASAASVVQTYVSLLPNFINWINTAIGKAAVVTLTSGASVDTTLALGFTQLLAFGYGLSSTTNPSGSSLTPAQFYALLGTSSTQQQAYFTQILAQLGNQGAAGTPTGTIATTSGAGVFPVLSANQPLFSGFGTAVSATPNSYSALFPIMQQIGAAFFANQRPPQPFKANGTVLENWALAFADHSAGASNYQQLANVGFTTPHLLTYLRTFLRFNHGLQQMTSVVTLAFDVLSTDYLNAFNVTADEVTKIALIEGIILDAV